MIKLSRSIALTVLCATSSLSAAPTQVGVERSEHPGDALRTRLGVTLPQANTKVIIYGVAQHHTRTEWSIVASRGKDGTWVVERAGEEGPGLLRIDPRPLEPSKTTLAPHTAAALDHLLRDGKSYREKVSGGNPTIGGYASTMEIITPNRTRKVGWTGKLTGNLGRIVDLVITPG